MKRNFSFYVARRYMFSKKSVGAINVISFISVTGVAVATMALVIVLSVFNGFHDLVASLFTNFDPQIEVVPAKGKTVNADAPELDKIRHLDFVDVATDVVEDQAIAGQTILRFMRPCVRDSLPTSTRRQTASWSTRCFRRALCSR